MGLFNRDAKKYGSNLGAGIVSKLDWDSQSRSQAVGQHSGSLSGAEAQKITADALWTKFAVGKVTCPGAMVHAYAEQGWAVKATVEVDLAALFAPGFVTCTAKSSVRGELNDAMFVGLLRFAHAMPSPSTVKVERPFALVVMTGKSGKAEFMIGGEVGLKASLSLDTREKGAASKVERKKKDNSLTPEKGWGTGGWNSADTVETLSFKLEAKLVGSLAVTVRGEWFRVDSLAPLFYQEMTDPDLSRDFGRLIGPGKKGDLKLHALAFLEREGPALNVEVPRVNAIQTLWDAKPKLDLIVQRLDQVIQAVNERHRSSHPNTQPPPQLPASDQSKVNEANFHKSMLGYLKDKTTREATSQSTLGGAMTRVSTEFAQGRARPFNFDALIPQLTFLSVSSFATEPSAGIEGKLEVSLAAQGAEVGAAATARCGLKWSGYRFQTFASCTHSYGGRPAKGPLVMTQDTNLFYKQVIAGFEGLKAALAVGPIQRQSEPYGEKMIRKNTLAYCSQTLFWAYPTRSNVRQLELGSGLSYGETLTAAELQKAIRLGDDTLAWRTALAEKLCVTLAQLEHFLDDDGLLLPLVEAENAVFLVESSFGVTATAAQLEEVFEYDYARDLWQVRSKPRYKPTRPGDLPLAQLLPMSSRPGQLEAIRLRRRVYDLQDDTAVKFKLGAKIAFVADVKIELEKVERAGHMVVEELAATYFGAAAATPPGVQGHTTRSPEMIVPPVVLFHQ